MRGLRGKGVLITGGSRGIGKATAVRFLEEGARVYICGLEPDEVERTLEELQAGGNLSGCACDVSQPEAVEKLVEQAEQALGRIDILINNAGTAWKESFVDISFEHWNRILEVNLRGMFLVAQAVSKRMIADGRGGVIVNMASTNGIAGEEMYTHYNASKGGVVLLTKTMALELGRHNIRVNALCPGYILTPLAETIDDPQVAAAYARDKIPLGRVGRPDEVAAAYAFLASDDASFVHGETLVIDGGQLAS